MKTKRIISCLLVVLMLLASVCQIVACDRNEKPQDKPNDGGTTTPGGSTGGGNGGGTTTQKVTYTVEIKTIGGMPLESVLVEPYNAEGKLASKGVRTNKNGIATLSLNPSEYKIKLSSVPQGYIVNSDGYDLKTTTKLALVSQVISDPDTTNVTYKLGDIIHDFTVTTTDGTQWTLSEELKTKKAVLINFWFTTCSFCIGEFPDMENAYKKYQDKLGLIAINGHESETAEDVIDFKKSFTDRYYYYHPYVDDGKFVGTYAISKDEVFLYTIKVVPNTNNNGEYLTTGKLVVDAISEDKSIAGEYTYCIDENNPNNLFTIFKNGVESSDFALSINDEGVYCFTTTDDGTIPLVKTAGPDLSLTFPMAKDPIINAVETPFAAPYGDLWGNPVSVIVDRYGVISMIYMEALPSERYFTTIFEYFTSDDYEQKLIDNSNIGELVPIVKPDVEMPSSEEMSEVLNGENIIVTYEPETNPKDAEYSWPFVITTTKDGVDCVVSSNSGIDNSYAILHAKVTLKAGEAVLFEYLSSCQKLYDVFYVIVDGEDTYTISGLSEGWTKCCPFVAEEDGTYDIALIYIKDETDALGDDAVYLKNFHVINEEELDIGAYVPRQASKNQTEDMSDYLNYVNVVLGDDGYYHVGNKVGPILLANLMGKTNFSSDFSVNSKLYETYDDLSDAGRFYVEGDPENKFKIFVQYCNYSVNSKLYGYCSVTEELKVLLDAFAKQNCIGLYSENTWLQLCSYYDAYGVDENGQPIGELEDVIAGLASFSAPKIEFTPVIDEQNPENSVLESEEYTFEYDRVIMPRGYFYAFTPTVSGAYRFTTKSTQEVDGWIYIGDYAEWIEKGDRILYTDSDMGERFCTELLVEKPDGTVERDYKNASMVAYLEAGKTYYIDFAYYDVYQTGSFTFTAKYLGSSFDYFVVASPVPFTYYETTTGEIGNIVAGGIDVILKDGYYYHKLEDGSCGSLIYADFHIPTGIFGGSSVLNLINAGSFDFSKTEADNMGMDYLNNYTIEELRKLWGADFDYYYEFYQLDDLQNGIYHGRGEDHTAEMREYIAKMENDTENHPERQGCVVVDERLAELLQMVMDKYTFAGVEHSWTKTCYYYKTLGAPQE